MLLSFHHRVLGLQLGCQAQQQMPLPADPPRPSASFLVQLFSGAGWWEHGALGDG